jgi:hypothetical protein
MRTRLLFSFIAFIYFQSVYSQCIGDVDISFTGFANDPKVYVGNLVTDASGNIYLIAGFQDTVRIGGYTFTEPTATPGLGLVVVKYDQNLNLIWANQINGDDFFAYQPAMAIRTDGTIVVAVNEINVSNGQTLRVEAYSNADPWEQLWARSYIPSGVGGLLFDGFGAIILPNRVVSDPSGNVYVTGDFDGTIDFGSATLTANPGVAESYLLKLDANGNNQWAIQSNGSIGTPETWNLKVAPGGSTLIVTGSYKGSVTYAGIAFTASTDDNGYVLSVDPATGNGNWARMVDGVQGSYAVVYGLDIDVSGNVYFTGFAKSPTVNSVQYTTRGNSDVFIGSFTNTGAFRWFNLLGGNAAGNEFGSSLIIGPDNALYISAALASDVLFYNNTEVTTVVRGNSLVKIQTNGQLTWISHNELFSYNNLITSTGNFIIGDGNQNTALTLRKISLAERPKPIAKVLTPNGTLLNPTVTFQAYNSTGYAFQWYQTPNTLLAGEVNVNYTASGAGNYYVQVNNGTCTVNSISVRAEGATTLASDSVALRELYLATGGSSWNRRANWLSGPVSTWEGVIVTAGRVTDLFLDQNNLAGNLPPSFWNMTGLQQFRMWGNPLLSLTLSAAVSNLTNLRVFDFGNAYVSGSLPVELATLPLLEEIQLYDTKNITGNIPTQFGSQNTLKTFNVSGTKLSGTFPQAIWALPLIEVIDVGGNGNLTVALPANLNTRVQLKTVSIWNTTPIKGAFPTAFTSLINLERLELGGHRFTGNVPTTLGNLTKLKVLNLTFNKLDGAFPASVANITTLEHLYLASNRFTSFPDFANSPGLLTLNISNNPVGFTSIIPNLDNGIPTFTYQPVARRDDIYTKVSTGATFNFTNPLTASGNVYQWIVNQDTIPGANSQNYSVTNFQKVNLGSYYCRVTNPAVPGVTIQTNFWNLALTGAPRSWTVDNKPGSVADFKDLYEAVYGTDDGDTLYVSGSPTPYGKAFMIVNSPRVIIGPGFFLQENTGNQFNTESAIVSQGMRFTASANGSVITGMEFSALIAGTATANQIQINNTFFVDGDTARNITITRNKFNGNAFIVPVSHVNGLNFTQNFGGRFRFYGTDDSRVRDLDNGIYKNFNISHNINLAVTEYFPQWPITPTRNGLENVVISNNILSEIRNVSGVAVSNNIIRLNNTTGNTGSNNVVTDYLSGGVFENASGTFTLDSDFKLVAGSPAQGAGSDGTDAGAFGSTTPYVLSGAPIVPSIYEVNDLGRLRFGVKAKSNQPSRPNLVAIEYIVSQNGVVIDKGTIKKITPYDSIDYGFRPRLTNVTPNGSYDLLYRVQDATGKYSVFSKTNFVATVTTVTGTVVTSTDQHVSPGQFFLFEVNLDGTGFDTLKTNVSNGSFVLPNVVIGDYLAAGFGDPTTYPDELPTYFNNTVFWEEADTLGIDDSNNVVALKLVARPGLPNGESAISGAFYEDDGTGSRINARKPIGSSGVSVRREKGVSSGRPTEVEYDLIAYVLTNANGEFTLPNLTPGIYLLNLQYPGYPMDPTSFINITIGTTQADKEVQVEAEVKDGLVKVRKIEITSLQEDVDFIIDVFPNPSATNIEIKGEDNVVQPKVYLMDTMGRTLRQKSGSLSQGISLDVSDLDTGVYLLKVIIPGKGVVKTSRVVIKK